MPCERTQQRVASRAHVIELARIGRHGLELRVSARGTGDGRLEHNFDHGADVKLEGNLALVNRGR